MKHIDPQLSPEAKAIATAVAIAGLSALVTGLVTWGIEALKKRLSPVATEPKAEAPK